MSAKFCIKQIQVEPPIWRLEKDMGDIKSRWIRVGDYSCEESAKEAIKRTTAVTPAAAYYDELGNFLY